ncbi:MAG: hypothetical protein OQK12_11945 [Motiliproteus sp.]|nr:hypothetical protein [Motiliproteus sp.]MCW9052633.1 hypothetical protein [Motiliproteus sp.]
MLEEDRIVAFIDVLGFSEVMTSDDDERRQKALQLLERIASYGSSHGVEVESLGIGQQVFFSAEVTTFSDNVVLSVPVADVEYESFGRTMLHPAPQFVMQLLQSIISIFWQGLHLGLLFRGGITTGRLYHSSNVVAGDALVRAVNLEKDTRFPRIEIASELIDKTDIQGRELLPDDVRRDVVVEEDGKFYLNTLGFHRGVWWDYFHFNTGTPSGAWKEVKCALRAIQNNTDASISRLEGVLENAKTGSEAAPVHEALKKWQWFQDEFEKAQTHEHWQRVWSAPETS